VPRECIPLCAPPEMVFWPQEGGRTTAHTLWPCANAEQISSPALEEQSCTAPNLALPGVLGCLLSPKTSLNIAAGSPRAPLPATGTRPALLPVVAVLCPALPQPRASAAKLRAVVLSLRKRWADEDWGYILLQNIFCSCSEPSQQVPSHAGDPRAAVGVGWAEPTPVPPGLGCPFLVTHKGKTEEPRCLWESITV